ncbi:macro domain-containing protein [Kribbella antibiotica]|uniref:macro domain-containing protein n=1 Tax=Kribbella antibiotica TaxID=190195 RepID=UPI001EDE7A96|nr:macro domain-containing protein [Kribbella antibiotica]
MLRTVSGDLLRDDADALVNAVNTAGVMGKGIALQFKQTWPDMFRDYRAACQRGEIQLGHMHVWSAPPCFIINFPTKQHWRSTSKLTDIEAGLVDLVRVIDELELESIAIPPLGCGYGGLTWADVEPLIHHELAPVADRVDIRIFAPAA